ncbi:thermonuclease family protein [Methylorubrum extorquens]|uniref:Thermonuclease family protein n=1 Tax=Methylorubrum extorquens TaxID=408 RepID=A0AAX3WCI8_METEX|nr:MULTISPECIES: thermonuclease family protein [Methylobacteriaceae]KQO94262.1 nuclease [Methylobacterium sp. Leaf92]KQQ17761.1 nuclease [Methylobacterium sp. Leaf122]WHQ69192.1 thermonuclease family protein [Methylorubrum extorquens]
MSLTATILLIYAACLAGTIASPARSHNDRPHDDRASEGPGARRLLAALLVPALALLAGLQAPPARAGEAAPRIVSGPATVIDGATLDLGGRRLRLYGMDAPDLDQTCSDGHERDYSCGRAAAAALTARIGGESVTCELSGADGTALCRRDGEDLAAWMVANGYAIADRSAPAAYEAQDRRAWGRRVGLWSGVFEIPADRRRMRRASASL